MGGVSAVIPAAGSGRRLGRPVRKQYIKLCGKPLLAHTLDAFEKCPDVDDIVLVVPPGDEEFCLREIVEGHHISKVREIVGGGDRRQESVFNGLMALGDDTSIVVIHDAVRPFIDPEDISGAIALCGECGAVVTAIPVSDTVKVSDGRVVEGTLDRSRLWLAQTPQVFRLNLIMEAYRRAAEDNFTATDDSSLVERTGTEVRIYVGSGRNIKVTTPDDLRMAELILRSF